MNYFKHRIKEDGWLILHEETDDGSVHTKSIPPNQPIGKYNEQIESDPDFEKYRTQENADAYEARLAELEPTLEELEQQKRNRMTLEAGDFHAAISLLSFENGTIEEVYDGDTDTGLTPLEDQIKSAISQLPKRKQIKFKKLFENRSQFRRTAPEVQAIAQALGMTDTDMDEFFTQTKQL